MLEKNLSNGKSLEVYVVISQKNLSCTIFDKKRNEQKSWELTVWILNLRVCYGSFVNWLFTKTKVGQFDMTLGIEQDIFRFEVTIDNALPVKMF